MTPCPALWSLFLVLAPASGPGALPERPEDSRTDAEIRARAGEFSAIGAGAAECARCRLAFDEPSARSRPFDEATGRSLLNYPPHRDADFQHMKLEIEIDDINLPRLTAVQTLTLTPLGRPLEELKLDARLMKIDSVASEGNSTVFHHKGQTLTIAFAPPAPAGVAVTLVTRYTLKDPPLGLVWTPESAIWPGRPAQIHTQGQPESNSYWFPCHDFPNERLTTELIASVPTGFSVCSNGRLVSTQKGIRAKTTAAGAVNLSPRDVFHWVQDRTAARGNPGDHTNYLVSMVVGKFDIVEVGDKQVKMPVYVPPGRGPDVAGTYGKTAAMAALFGRLFSEPYPWTKYAQVLVWNFGAGGMENTSATTLFDTAIISKQGLLDHDLDGLISHELAHQWFGDLVTCNSWEHVWLNEGFATYLSALWYETGKFPYGGPEAYQSSIRGNFDAVIASDKPDAPFQPAMCSKVYEHPWEALRRAANPYSKGSSILHMLRRQLGDDLFFKGVALYIDRFKGKTVETDDFRKALEEVSGESLERFFYQWCMRPGVPTLKIDIGWTPDTPTLSGQVKGTLKVSVEQTQHIDAYNPAFAFRLPVYVVAPAGSAGAPETRWLSIDVQEKTAGAEIVLDGEPRIVAVDPDLAVLAGMAISQPVERWERQLKEGPTHASRVQAARALGASPADQAGEELLALVLNPKAATPLRIEAVKALEARNDTGRVETALIGQLAPPPVRVAAIEAAAGLAARASDDAGTRFRSRTLDLLLRAYRGDRAMKTRAAAIAGLGRLKATEHLPVVLEAADAESQDDVIRQAALEALANMNSSAALPVALKLARPGTLSRTRPKAIETAVRLASHDKEKVFETLVTLLEDREVRTRVAARQGLADLGDPRAEPILAKLETSAPGDEDRLHAGKMLRKLKEKQTKPETTAGN